MRGGPKRGRTALSNNPDPNFENCEWGVDIDWSEQPHGTIDEAVAAELVKRLPVSLVQSAADYLVGDGVKLQAWRVARGKHQDRKTGPKTIDWKAMPLGSMPDFVIAKQIGVTQPAVTAAREKLGIPAFSKRAMVDRTLLGKIPDAQLATKSGVTKTVIRAMRKEMGIKNAISQK